MRRRSSGHRRAALRGVATIPAQRQFNFSNRGFRWRGSTTRAGLGSVPGAQVQMAAEEAMQEQSDPSVTIERVSLSFYFYFGRDLGGHFQDHIVLQRNILVSF